MKNFVFILLFGCLALSCSEDTNVQDKITNKKIESSVKNEELNQIIASLKSSNKSMSELTTIANNEWLPLIENNPNTRTFNSIYDNDETLSKVIEDMTTLNTEGLTVEEFKRQELSIINASIIAKDSKEYKILTESIDVTILILNLGQELCPMTKGWWQDWGSDLSKCAAGILGAGITGGLVYGGAGTFTVPVIGTVTGATLGMVAGGLSAYSLNPHC